MVIIVALLIIYCDDAKERKKLAGTGDYDYNYNYQKHMPLLCIKLSIRSKCIVKYTDLTGGSQLKLN
jgi:hypothetical protein